MFKAPTKLHYSVLGTSLTKSKSMTERSVVTMMLLEDGRAELRWAEAAAELTCQSQTDGTGQGRAGNERAWYGMTWLLFSRLIIICCFCSVQTELLAALLAGKRRWRIWFLFPSISYYDLILFRADLDLLLYYLFIIVATNNTLSVIASTIGSHNIYIYIMAERMNWCMTDNK